MTAQLGTSRLALGTVVLWLSVIVLLPLAAVLERSFADGLGGFVDDVTSRQARHALLLTVGLALVVTVINAIFGTITAWVLVRDEFPGKKIIDTLIDLPFALPTIVAGITLLALYGPDGPLGTNVRESVSGIMLAMMFVTLPFVVRSVQPVLIELDREMEDAALSLGASPLLVLRRIILPNLWPAILSGAALAFARAVGEFGSIVLISNSAPFETQVASVYIFKQNESDNLTGAASVSVVLLALSLIVLIGIRYVERWSSRHG